MAWIGAKQYVFLNPGQHVVKLIGIFMHNTSALGTSPGFENRRYAQLFVLDPKQIALSRYESSNKICDVGLIEDLERSFVNRMSK